MNEILKWTEDRIIIMSAIVTVHLLVYFVVPGMVST